MSALASQKREIALGISGLRAPRSLAQLVAVFTGLSEPPWSTSHAMSLVPAHPIDAARSIRRRGRCRRTKWRQSTEPSWAWVVTGTMNVRGTALTVQYRRCRTMSLPAAPCAHFLLRSASAASHGFHRARVAACRRFARNPFDARGGVGADGAQDHLRKPRVWRAALVRVLSRLVLRCCCSFRWARGKGVRARGPPAALRSAAGLRVTPERVASPPPLSTAHAAAVAERSLRRRLAPRHRPTAVARRLPTPPQLAGVAAVARRPSVAVIAARTSQLLVTARGVDPPVAGRLRSRCTPAPGAGGGVTVS